MSLPGSLSKWMDNNKEFAKNFKVLSSMKDMRSRSKAGGKATFVLTCLDPRCVPETFFGPDFLGPVFRNAGGKATADAIRSIAVLRYLAGVETVAVVHHTDCGMTHLTDEGIAKEALERTPNASKEIENIEFGCFKEEEYEETIKADVRTLRDQKILSGMEILGFKLDTFTGTVEELHFEKVETSRM